MKCFLVITIFKGDSLTEEDRYDITIKVQVGDSAEDIVKHLDKSYHWCDYYISSSAVEIPSFPTSINPEVVGYGSSVL